MALFCLEQYFNAIYAKYIKIEFCATFNIYIHSLISESNSRGDRQQAVKCEIQLHIAVHNFADLPMLQNTPFRKGFSKIILHCIPQVNANVYSQTHPVVYLCAIRIKKVGLSNCLIIIAIFFGQCFTALLLLSPNAFSLFAVEFVNKLSCRQACVTK